MIDKLVNFIRPTQSTIYDTESLTMLESIGKIIEKVNNCIEHFNNLENKTNEKVIEFKEMLDNYTKEMTRLYNKYYNELQDYQFEIRKTIEDINKINDNLNYINEQSKIINDIVAQTKQDIESAQVVSLNQFNELKESNNKLNNRMDELYNNSIKDSYIAGFFESNTKLGLNLFVSNDGENFDRIGGQMVQGRDFEYYYENGYFYIFTTQQNGHQTNLHNFNIFVSKDLQTFEEHKIVLGDLNSTNYQCWAPDLFIDDDGRKYIIYSRQVGTMNDKVTNNNLADMRPCIVEILDLKNMTFGTPRLLNLNNYNRIDGHIEKKDNEYYLFIKKEGNEGVYTDGQISIWKSKDLINWSEQVVNIPPCLSNPYEACYIEKIGDYYYLYLDDYKGKHGGNMQYTKTLDFVTWTPVTPINFDVETRHGFVKQIKDLNEYNTIYRIKENFNKNNVYMNKPQVINIREDIHKDEYLQLMKIKVNQIYKSGTIIFNLCNVQSLWYNSQFILNYTKRTSLSKVEVKELSRYGWSISPFLKCVYNDDEIYLYFLNTLSANTPSINIISNNIYLATIDIEPNVSVTKLPEINECEIQYINQDYGDNVKRFDIEGTGVTFKTRLRNGVSTILGHANNMDFLIDVKIFSLNGVFKIVKAEGSYNQFNINLTPLDDGFTVQWELTNLPARSVFDVTLTNTSYFLEE